MFKVPETWRLTLTVRNSVRRCRLSLLRLVGWVRGALCEEGWHSLERRQGLVILEQDGRKRVIPIWCCKHCGQYFFTEDPWK